jgi:hypothetical protein
VAGEVFRCSTNRNSTLEDLQADVCPLANGLEVDATVNQCLREISPASAKSVGTDSHRTRDFVSFEKLDSLFETIETPPASDVRS